MEDVMGKKAQKQFPLDSKENCIIYLVRIISSCEKCMDRLKLYNREGKNILEKYYKSDTIPYDVYADLLDKSANVMSYLLNLLGDAQDSSISYFKFRKVVLKRQIIEVTLLPLDNIVQSLLEDFNKMRNWQNHIPESLLIAELDEIKAKKMSLTTDPVKLIMYKTVSYNYFKDLIETNKNFYVAARKIIQAAKKDYSNLCGKSVRYNRIYTEKALDFDKSGPAKKSAKVQGIKGNLL